MLAPAAGALAQLSDEARLLMAQGADAEKMASEILWRKQMLVDLDRQRGECRQALRACQKQKAAAAAGAASSAASSSRSASSSSSSVPPSSLPPSAVHAPAPSKFWVLSFGGSTFVRTPAANVQSMLEADQSKLNAEYNRVRSEMKSLMDGLRELVPALNVEAKLLDFALKEQPEMRSHD